MENVGDCGILKKQDIDAIVSKIDKENAIFANKSYLDTLTSPAKILGREEQMEALVRYLLGYKQGHVVPMISVYGRSGSGKSTIVKFVCQSLDDVSYCFVNLRKSKTVFGATNLILAELGEPNLKNAQGLNLAVENIGKSIESRLEKEKKKLFVLILDEYDVLFYDKRNNPSDFVYKLITLEEDLKEKNLLLCIVAISNNALAGYELADRVKSRIGNAEVFFVPYSLQEVLEILKERAGKAFSKKIDAKVLYRCAELSSQVHGDARRAIELLTNAAEISAAKKEKLSVSHVDKAVTWIEKDRISFVLSSATSHMRVLCLALARIAYLTDQSWHSTSTIDRQYRKIISEGISPVGYRRVSDLLVDLENTGIVNSQARSNGRHGYGKQYKLTVPPEMVGSIIGGEWWSDLVDHKLQYEKTSGIKKILGKKESDYEIKTRFDDFRLRYEWESFVGLD